MFFIYLLKDEPVCLSILLLIAIISISFIFFIIKRPLIFSSFQEGVFRNIFAAHRTFYNTCIALAGIIIFLITPLNCIIILHPSTYLVGTFILINFIILFTGVIFLFLFIELRKDLKRKLIKNSTLIWLDNKLKNKKHKPFQNRILGFLMNLKVILNWICVFAPLLILWGLVEISLYFIIGFEIYYSYGRVLLLLVPTLKIIIAIILMFGIYLLSIASLKKRSFWNKLLYWR